MRTIVLANCPTTAGSPGRRDENACQPPEHPPFQNIDYQAYLPSRGPLPTSGKVSDNLDYVQ